MGAGADDTPGTSVVNDTRPFAGFEEQARATLAVLREFFPFDRWAISRLVDGALVVQFVEPVTEPLTAYPWADTICAQMVELRGPSVAPSVAAVAAYATTLQCRERGIGAYAGAPLYDHDGLLWGALSATHPTALETDPIVDETFLRWIARSLSTHLLSAAASLRRDPARGSGPNTILDLDMWSTMLEKEHERSARTGATACVIELEVTAPLVLPLGNGGVAALVDRAAQLVAVGARGCDFVGRTGPNRVGVLAVNCPADNAGIVMDRLVAELGELGIPANATMVDLLPRAVLVDKIAEAPAVITYALCGWCRRKGAYVSPRFAVLRCKYCGGRHPLSENEWRDALNASSR